MSIKAQKISDDMSASPQTRGQTDGKADGQTRNQTDRQTVRQNNGQIDRQLDRSTDRQKDRHIDEQINEHLEGQEPLDPFYWISENQAKVLSFLMSQSQHITRLSDISKHTGVAYGTVRGALRTLVKEGCITKPVRYRRGKYHGISYRINDKICAQFKNSCRHRQISEQNNGQIQRQTDKRTGALNSSSYNKTTTKISDILASHPELEYWRKKGLAAKQIKQWVKIAECDAEIMIQYLCYCRYEMEIMGVEASKPIQNVFNWFFKIIEKTGCYPRPKGYKSFQEVKNEQEQKIVLAKQKEAEAAERIYRERLKAERKKIFFDMMSAPDSDIYKKCLEKLMPNQKRNKTSKQFETAMWNRFNWIMDEDTE